MNFHTAHSPYLFYPYFPFPPPDMNYYQYPAPYFQTYEEFPLKKEEKTIEKPSKLSQSHFQNNAEEQKSQNLLKKKINSSTSNRSKNRKKEGDQDYQERQQTPQRNSFSNTIKFFIRYVLLKSHLARQEIKKILDRFGFQYDAKDFVKALEQEFNGKMNYISKDCIENIWLEKPKCFSKISGNRRSHFCLIFRELFNLYFEEIVYGDKLFEEPRRRKYDTIHKKCIKIFVRQLENKQKKKNESAERQVLSNI